MKKTIIFLLATFISVASMAQLTAAEKDSVANAQAFQLKVKIASLSAANDLLADTTTIWYVANYAQTIITSPSGGNWLTVLSYGVLTNPVITGESSQGDIQFTVNSIFTKYAAAEYRIVKPSQRTAAVDVKGVSVESARVVADTSKATSSKGLRL